MVEHGLPEALRHLKRLALVGVRQDYGKLLASVTGRRIIRANRLLQDLREFLEHDIPLGMTEPVVDLLEVIDVNEQNGDMVLEALALEQLVGEVFLEVLMIEKPGQPVQVDEFMGGSRFLLVESVLRKEREWMRNGIDYRESRLVEGAALSEKCQGAQDLFASDQIVDDR